MGFVASLIAPERRETTLRDPARWLLDWVSGGTPSASGKHVNETLALSYSAVYACVRVIAETIASLPWIVYRRLPDGGKERAVSHRLYSILHDAPNPEMTRVEFVETIVGHLELWGNAYAEIESDGSGRVTALWPLRPDRMTVLEPTSERGRMYVYALADGSQTALTPGKILHFRGLGGDGRFGYSPIRLAREAIGLGLAAEEFGARFFANDSRPGGVLQHPGRLSESAAKRLKESWEDLHRSLTNKHRVAILEEGITWQSIGIPPEDAQFLETRKFQTEEIARIFRVPLHKIQNLDRATFSNIEHQAIEFVVDTVRPRCVRLEQRVNQQLFSDTFRQTHFSEFLLDGLLRGDIKSRYEAYQSARYAGWMTTNEIRERENLNPIDGGDALWMPVNMANAATYGGPAPGAKTGGAT